MTKEFDIGPVRWVLDREDLEEMAATLVAAPEVVFDLETTGLHDHAVLGGAVNGGVPARIVMATFTVEDGSGTEAGAITYVLPLHHPWSPFLGQWRLVLKWVLQRLRKAKKPLIGHNLKFDIRWSHTHTGVNLARFTEWDTQVSSHMLDENSSTKLKEVAPDLFNIKRWDESVDLTKPGAAEKTDIWVLGDYAARDTYWTWRVSKVHRRIMSLDPDYSPSSPDEIEDFRLGELMEHCSKPTSASLTQIEENGIGLDLDWVMPELTLHKMEADLALDELAEHFQMDRETATTAATSKWFQEMTTLAVEEGDLRVTALTDSGNPQWNKSVLKRQAREGYGVAGLILRHRDHAKKAEFLQSWIDHVAPDGRIHSTYRAGHVVTGRLSSASPNMQQVTKSLKPAFIPSPGHVIIDLDYSQIELRVAAFVSRNEAMIDAYQKDMDLHRMMGARITGKGLEDVTADERQGGKSANFGLLYGMQAKGYREYAEDVYDVHYTLDEAIEVRDAFFKQWEGLDEWHERVIETAHNFGQVTSPIGRVRRVPGVFMDDWGMRSYSERAAINSPVQGMASDMMQIAAASIQGLMPGHKAVRGTKVVGTVHDSIIIEAEADRWEAIAMECQYRMTVVVKEVLGLMGCTLDVPIQADAIAGTRWGMSDVGVIE